MRFVVIATLQRGVLPAPEPLDADGQAAAMQRVRGEEELQGLTWTREERDAFFGVKKAPPVSVGSLEYVGRVRRMVELASKRRSA